MVLSLLGSANALAVSRDGSEGVVAAMTASLDAYDRPAQHSGSPAAASNGVAVHAAEPAQESRALARDLAAATRVAAEEATAASRALSRFPKAAQRSEKPPGFDPQTYQWREASRSIPEKHWWDPAGGEWRYHGADKWHEPHWDYNPWSQWNSPWQHIYPGAGP